MRKPTATLKIGILLCPLMLSLSACNSLENDSTSNTMLLVESMKGLDISAQTVDFLQSDVVKVDATTGQTSIVSDSAKATLRASMLDPAPLATSQYNDVQLRRYVVTYTRTDGKNQAGVDVPYPIEGSLTATVKINSTTEVAFVIVKESAKLEPPLYALRQVTGDTIIQAKAKVDFYGQDLAGKNVKATGWLDIYFANYVDK